MPSIAQPVWSPAELDDRVEAFEAAWNAGSADLDAFLPPPDDSAYFEILCELIRVDLDRHWSSGRPRSLHSYLADYPQLNADRDVLGQLAFEEYRQRLQAGQPADPDEYARAFDLNVSRWPKPPANRIVRGSIADADSPPTHAVAAGEIRKDVPGVEFPRVGDEWHGFKLVQELGRGSFGRVFLARQGELSDRLVALKLSTDLRGEPEKLARLQHTNIMPVHSAHRYEQLQAVCMPYFGSTTLAHILKGLRQAKLPSSGRMFLSTLFGRSHTVGTAVSRAAGSTAGSHADNEPRSSDSARFLARSFAELERLARMSHVEAVLWIIARVADGLAHAHERGILHRDLKPANVLLTDDGQPMLLDFNLAANLRPTPADGRVRNGGTFPYMAPEQLEGSLRRQLTIDCRCDLYSLGIILFELLTSRHPFDQPSGPMAEVVTKMLAQRRKGAPDPRRLNPSLSPAVAAIVRKLLAPDPAQRYQTARQLLEDLERQLSHRPLKNAPNVSWAERFDKFRKRHPRVGTAISVAAAVGLLVVLPASISAYRQNEIARRAREVQRAEALNLMRQSEQTAYSARAAMLLKNERFGLRHQGLALAQSVAANYAAEHDEHWLDRPQIARLSDAERRELLGNLGDTFLITAEAYNQEAADKHDEALRDTARKWNRLAESCFSRLGQPPDRVARQRSALDGWSSPLLMGSEKADDLEKLDAADLYSLASELYSAGRYRRASAALKVLTRKDPSNFMAWYLQGLTSYSLGDMHGGITALTTSIALRPDFSWAHFHRGLLQFEANQISDAIADFDRAIEFKHHNMTEALVHRGIAKRQLKDFAGAEKDFTAALAREDAPMRGWYLRAEMRKEIQDQAGADRDYRTAESLTPHSEVDWTIRGYFHLKNKQFEAALNDFDCALEQSPRYLHALQNKAVVLEQMNRQGDALAVYDRLVEFFPDRLKAHADRGVVLARLGKIREADEEAQYALALDRSAFCRYQIGSLYAKLAEKDPKYKQQALNLLAESLRLGLERRDLFKIDTDLDPIRGDSEFQKLANIAAALQPRRGSMDIGD